VELFDQLNAHRYLYLTHLEEPEDNALRLIVTEARRGEPSDAPDPSLEGLGRLATGTRPIVADERCAVYELHFEDYIAYAVLNESFIVADEREKFEGRLFRIYSESKFLAYIAAGTIATADYPGPFKHYELACLNHIIEIASTEPPTITLLRPSTATLRRARSAG
jgi:hypothetical protein